MMQNRVYLDEGAKGILILLLGAQLFLTNGIYLFFGFLCLCFLLYYLHQPFKPSIFTLVFIYHFLQISAWVWLCNYLGKEINYKSDHSGTAVITGYVALFFLFLPIIHQQNKLPSMSREVLLRHADKLSLEKSFWAYVIAFFVAGALGAVALFAKGFSQVILSFINIKWIFFVLFGFQVILKKRMVKEFVIIITIEFLVGFFSFFSDFKTVIFYLAFIFLTFISTIHLKHVIIAIIVLGFGFFLGVLWSGIKGEYRQFLNQGSSSQTVQVSKSEAFSKILELSEGQDNSAFDESAITLLDRLQYTYHLARAMDWVPSRIPYQNGDNWGSSVSFALTPRLLNPNKPKYEASSKTTKYTGIGYLGAASGVSVSLGYFADSYVDFGYIFMFLPLLIIGFIYAMTYKYFLKNASQNFLFNYAVVSGLYMEFMAIEMDSTYFVGRFFATMLTFFILKITFFPWLMRSLKPPAAEPTAWEIYAKAQAAEREEKAQSSPNENGA